MKTTLKTIALKLTTALTLIISAFAAAPAHAILQAPGTFVPEQCGANQSSDVSGHVSAQFVEPSMILHIQQVCLGRIVGEKQRVVGVRFSDATTRIYYAALTSNNFVALDSGNEKALMQLVSPEGSKATMRVIRTPEGDIQSATGSVDGLNFFIPQFETIFTIQKTSVR